MNNTSSPNTRCTCADRVLALAAGGFEVHESEQIEEHLANCPECSALVDALDDASDAVIQQLSSLPGSAEDEPEFRRLEAQLMSGLPVVAEALSGQAERRLADPEVGPLPQRLANYELLERIGRGAWGAVFRARHIRLEQIVAVKVLDASRLQGAHAVDRFVQELKAVGQLRHLNIVQATDAGEERGFHYLVMEYIDGIDTARLLAEKGTLAVADACEIVRQAAAALDFAHGRGWIHRDVKPSNLMIAADGTVKLLDLGIAGQRDESPGSRPGPQVPLGTADYMAPEQWTHFAEVDARADVYGLGCTLFKLLTGRVPAAGDSAASASTSAAVGDEAAPAISAYRPDAHRGLDRFVQRMLARQPEDRVATAAEVARTLATWTRRADLRVLVGGDRGGETSTELDAKYGPVSGGRPARRLSRRYVVGGAVAAAGAALLVPWFLIGQSPQLRRAGWRALEPVPPAILLTADMPEQVRVEVAEPGRIALQSDGTLLVHLGRAVSGVFAMRVALERMEWDGEAGGAGVFFQYRRADELPSVCEFQCIELRPGEYLPGESAGSLVWSRCTGEIDAGELVIRREPWAETEVDLHADGTARPVLEVVLGRSGFPEVSWNGQSVEKSAWTLSTEGRRQASSAPDRVRTQYLGRLGLLNLGGTTTFLSPQLAYL